MTVAAALFESIAQVASTRSLPPVRRFELPPPEPVDATNPAGPWRICNHFAALVLDDGTVGMTYTAIDGALEGLLRERPHLDLAGLPAVQIAALYAQPAGWQRSLGLAAINAISQVVLRERADLLLPSPDTLQMLAIEPGDRVGMVGWFGRLVEPIRAAGAELTVIELDPRYLARSGPGLAVSLDPVALRGCTKVLLTGTTLLNGTLDRLLDITAAAERVCMIGPTAGCLPDALFARGLSAIGGIRVDSIDRFMALWSEAGRWREAGTRYRIERATWPRIAPAEPTADRP
ncbi:MAG: DUF364 domain-containing protein [Lautropia sp.]